MSCIFEGVICPVKLSDLDFDMKSMDVYLNIEADGSIQLASVQLDQSSSAVYVSKSQPRGMFVDAMETIALSLSQTLGNTLLVRYDDRVGHRSAAHFEQGQEKELHDVSDEIYVMLDDDGEPILSGKHYTNSELEEDREYETIENAIQIGLKKFGVGNWEHLWQLIHCS